MGRKPIFDNGQNEEIESLLLKGDGPKEIFAHFVAAGYINSYRTLQNRIYEARVRLRQTIISQWHETHPEDSEAMAIYNNCYELLTPDDLLDPQVKAVNSLPLEPERAA